MTSFGFVLCGALLIRDLNLGLGRSLHGDHKWRGVHSNGRAVVKDLTRSIHCIMSRVEAIYGRYRKTASRYILANSLITSLHYTLTLKLGYFKTTTTMIMMIV